MAEQPLGRRPLVIAHAACKGHAPENTLAGIRAALEFGSDGIEIDVHTTADGVPVLLHDDTLDRTTSGSGEVYAHTLAQLRQLDAGVKSFDGRFAGERIPTLVEVLDLTRGHALLVIEIKQPNIEREVVEVVRRANAARDAMVWCFQPAVVKAVRALAPEIPCGQSWSARTPDIERMFATALAGNAQAVVPEHTLVDAELLRAALLRGLTVYTWTPDEQPRIDELRALSVDGVCTNYPERVRGAAARRT